MNVWMQTMTAQTFRKWVNQTQPPSDWLTVKALKQKPVVALSAFTPSVLHTTLDELEQVLLETGIAFDSSKLRVQWLQKYGALRSEQFLQKPTT